MRYGFSGNLVAREDDPLGIWCVELLAECGYDFIELPICEVVKLPADRRDALKRRIAACGIGCDVVNMFFDPALRLTGPDVDGDGIRAYYLRVMDAAADLGVETIVFGSPGAKSYPAGFSPERAWEQLLELHRRIDRDAAGFGLTVAIEPVRSPECNLVTTFAQGCRLAEQVGGANTRVLVDYYHMLWERESPDVLRAQGARWLHHVHFAAPYIPGEGERSVPLSIDEWNYRPFLDALREIGYDQTVTVEAYTRNLEQHAPRALRLMRENF